MQRMGMVIGLEASKVAEYANDTFMIRARTRT